MIPHATPAPTTLNPRPATFFRMSSVRAPSATRIPISRVRWVTRYVATPYAPPIASTNARNANTASIHENAARSASERRRLSSIVRTPNTGSSGSSCRTISRIVAAIDCGSTVVCTAIVKVERGIAGSGK